MTDTTEDLELFDDAQATFANKLDLKDRLVLVWVTGKHGTEKGANGPYEWYETFTLVLDDGPNWTGQVYDAEKEVMRPVLVPSVAGEGPQLLERFRYSFGGMVARLALRVTGDKPKSFKPMLGRLNSRPNAVKGMAPSWSVAEPTEDDRQIAIKHADLIRQTSEKVRTLVNGGTDEDAFE
jgi:hypothetical protein